MTIQIARLPEITQLLFDPDEQTQEEATREFRKLLSIGLSCVRFPSVDYSSHSLSFICRAKSSYPTSYQCWGCPKVCRVPRAVATTNPAI